LGTRPSFLVTLWRNVEKGSPGDESGGVFQRGKALKGETPRAAAARNRAARKGEDQTLKGLRKAEEGWCPGGAGQLTDSPLLDR
jgi:hypothetical protein